MRYGTQQRSTGAGQHLVQEKRTSDNCSGAAVPLFEFMTQGDEAVNHFLWITRKALWSQLNRLRSSKSVL